MIQRDIRDYEVSVWTLQDSFITVLKSSKLEHKGQIQDPDMHMIDDGTLIFSFKIPMYLHNIENNRWFDVTLQNVEVKKNPLWANIVDGTIIANLRKIKVIFNKMTDDEEVYEFLIMKVNEEHKNEEKWCSVECEGLAFQELGKIGYKLSLTENTYFDDYDDWAAKPENEQGKMPVNNINYWLDKTFANSQWDYEVAMDWSMYDGITHYKKYTVNEKNLFSNSKLEAGKRIAGRNGEEMAAQPNDIISGEIAVDFANKDYYFSTDANVSYYVIAWGEDLEGNEYHIGYRQLTSSGGNLRLTGSWIKADESYALTDIKKIRIQFMQQYGSSLALLNNNNQLIETDSGIVPEYNKGPNSENNVDFLFTNYGPEYSTVQYGDLTAKEKALINDKREQLGYRRHDCIYEEPYVSAWDYNQSDTTITASEEQLTREKYRLIKCETSNRYNITQTVAETFGVFCKYKYDHDDNYHITGRHVIFYNNFLQESTGAIDLTYPYDTSSVTREMDSSDTVTKMYVKNLVDETMPSGWVTIGDTPANKSGEDYLLNFDYLYTIGTLTQEQYDEIPKFEYYMGKINKDLTEKSNQLILLYQELPDIQAYKTVAENAQALDVERISATDDLKNSLTNSTGLLHRTAQNPMSLVVLDGNYVNIREKGVLIDTLRLYEEFNSTSHELSNPIETFTCEKDEYGNFLQCKDIKLIDSTNTRIYATYDYEPELYYDQIKKVWEARLAKDQADAQKYAEKEEAINTRIAELETEYDELLAEKAKKIAYFERIMGPAIREGNWQPEDNYSKYCTHNEAKFTMGAGASYKDNQVEFIWDSELFEDEERGYSQIGVEEKVMVFPCIDISGVYEKIRDAKGTVAFAFNDLNPQDSNTLKYRKYFALGSQAFLHYIKTENGNPIPVLMITDIENIYYGNYNSVYEFFLRGDADAKIVSLEAKTNENSTITIIEDKILPDDGDVISFVNQDDFNVNSIDDITYKVVYPRLRFNSPYLQTSTNKVALKTAEEVLPMYEDYYILTRYDEKSYYYLTIKPQIFIYNTGTTCVLNYLLSDAAIAIYLDALEVLRENAYPKVSYTIDVSMVKKEFIHVAYKTLSKIVHINDTDLKFKDVQGYISELELRLDKPWEDKITIKNYKTKFEDLFSSIVAQTEAMKKNSYITDIVGQAFTTAGQLQSNAAQLLLGNMSYSMNGGKLVVSQDNGIWGVSKDGVVAFRSDGIFTANEVDDEGNWIWNTGIYPSGINANLITAGQLDTNLINIYAGDNLKFKMNGEGIFAYKSLMDETEVGGLEEKEQDLFDFLKASSDEINIYYGRLPIILPAGHYIIKTNMEEPVSGAGYLLEPTPQENIVSAASVEEFIPITKNHPANFTIEENSEGWFKLRFLNNIRKDYWWTIKQNNYNDDIDNYYVNSPQDLNLGQYVTLNENGLFLRAEKGAPVIQGNTLVIMPETVDRVEISWDGLKLRNWNNEEVFYADPDTGNLTLKGTIYAEAGIFSGDLMSATVYADSFKIKVNPEATGDGESIMHYIDSNIASSSTLQSAFKTAANIINQAFVPSSGDISADGLVSEMAETINTGRRKIWTSNKGFYPSNFFIEQTIESATVIYGAFHEGDVWNYVDNTVSPEVTSVYIAIMDGSQVRYTPNSSVKFEGWNRVQDGAIKSLDGTNISIDTQTGNIEVKAINNLLLSGADLQITGNYDVNIGAGRSVNLDVIVPNNNNEVTGLSISGAGLDFKTADTNNISALTINSTTGLDFKTANNTNASVLKINPTDGFQMATGGLNTNNVAIVEIKDSGILLSTVGRASNGGTYVSLNNNSIELFAGRTTNEDGTRVILDNNHFHINAIESDNDNAESLTNTYVDISAHGIDIGSNGIFSVKMDNFKVQGNLWKLSYFDNEYTYKQSDNNCYSYTFSINVKENTNYTFKTNFPGSESTLSTSDSSPLFVVCFDNTTNNITGGSKRVFNNHSRTVNSTSAGKLYFQIRYRQGRQYEGEPLTNSIIRIIAENYWWLLLEDGTEDFFFVGDNSQYMKFTADGNLIISGQIRADSGHIGPWSIGENSIFYGNNENTSDYRFGTQGLSIGGIFNVNTNQDSENIFNSFIIKDLKDDGENISNDLFGIMQEEVEDANNLFPTNYSESFLITGLEKNTNYTISLTKEDSLTNNTLVNGELLKVYFCTDDESTETEGTRLFSNTSTEKNFITKNSGEMGRFYLYTIPNDRIYRNYVISCLPRLVKVEKKYKLTGSLLSQIDSAVTLANKISENIGQTKIKYTTTLSGNTPALGGNPGDICVYYNEKSTHEPENEKLIGEVLREGNYYLPVGTNFENDGYAASRNESRFGHFTQDTTRSLVSRWNTSALSGTNFSISDQATFPSALKTRYVRVGKVQGYTGTGTETFPNRFQSGIYGLYLPWVLNQDLEEKTTIKIYYSYVRNISGATYDQIPYSETSNYGTINFMIGHPARTNITSSISLDWNLHLAEDYQKHFVNFTLEGSNTPVYAYRITPDDSGLSYNIRERCLIIELAEALPQTTEEPYYLVFQTDQGSAKNSLLYIDSLSVTVCNSEYELDSSSSGIAEAAIYVYSNNTWVKIGP